MKIEDKLLGQHAAEKDPWLNAAYDDWMDD
jgi:hypothetical protein